MNTTVHHKGMQSAAAPDEAAIAAASSSSLREEARWYLNQALEFEKSKQASQKRQTTIAWRVAGAGMVIGAICIIGTACLVELKRPNPPAVLRDNTVTGAVDVLSVVRDGQLPFGELEDRADLRRYVTLRESYDWETIQDNFDAVKLMSADRERGQYVGLFSLPNAPQKILKDQFRVVAQVGAITFIGRTAQVFFSKKLVSLGGGMQPKTEYWVATIAYRHDNLPEKKSELEVDPTGFRVTSYTVDRDWTRTSDQGSGAGTPQVPMAPSAAPQPEMAGGQQ